MKNNLKKVLGVSAVAVSTVLASQYAMAAGVIDKIKSEIKEEIQGDELDAKQVESLKITLTDAVKKAQEKQSGIPVKAKLESEDGKLSYEVKLLDNGKKVEVNVDAVTGEVSTGDDK